MRPTFTLILATSLLAGGCSSSSQETDPTSKEALHVAAPVHYGCTYTETSTDYVGGRNLGTSNTNHCSEQKHCSELGTPSDVSGMAGGSSYYTISSYVDRQDFMGTCDDPRPITCDPDTASTECDACMARSCCAPASLCSQDPNCKAVIDCLTNCKDDKSCISRCLDNGEPTAVNNLRETVSCMTDSCASTCN